MVLLPRLRTCIKQLSGKTLFVGCHFWKLLSQSNCHSDWNFNLNAFEINDKLSNYYKNTIPWFRINHVWYSVTHMIKYVSHLLFFICWSKPTFFCSFLNAVVEPIDPYQSLTEDRGILKGRVTLLLFIKNINLGCLRSMGNMNTSQCMISYEFRNPPHLW